MYIDSLKRSENYKAQSYQYASSSKQILKAKAKPFPPCTQCGFNDYRHDDCRNYPECEIYRSYDHSTSGHNHVIQIRGGVLPESSTSCKFDAKTDDGYFLGYILVTKSFQSPLNHIKTTSEKKKETYHVTFDESMEDIRFTNTLVDEIGIDDSSRYPPDEFQEDDPSRQYQVASDVSYFMDVHSLNLPKKIMSLK
ncbi:hypothetical protein Tco_1578066 [Tanacetum coccineum]